MDAAGDSLFARPGLRIPGAWENESYKILNKYGVEYVDRSVSM